MLIDTIDQPVHRITPLLHVAAHLKVPMTTLKMFIGLIVSALLLASGGCGEQSPDASTQATPQTLTQPATSITKPQPAVVAEDQPFEINITPEPAPEPYVPVEPRIESVISMQDLPETFEKPEQGEELFVGIRRTRGIAMPKIGSTYPVYITMVPNEADADDPLLIGDVVLAVNGKPIGDADAPRTMRAMLRELDADEPVAWLTRWRDGEVEQVMVEGGSAPIDLRVTGEPGPTRDWRLGPLGANGWAYSELTIHGASRKSRQMIITLVDEDGPAAGKLQVGDVLLGANGEMFSYDVRKALAAAINEAEKEENNGELVLNIWRDGEEMDVTLELPVMGTYSATTPFDCPKTEKIIDNAVAYLLENADQHVRARPRGWLDYINGLGLLATGREDVMPVVTKLAHDSLLKEGETLSVDKHVPMMSWWWGYRTLFLCEYYLRTGDEKVLPTIEEYATNIALGQSGVGTWGHTYAAKENTGEYHGHLGGYGALNQIGITMQKTLPLAKKCGIENDVINASLERGDRFLRYFIDKGAIPYGDHGPHNQWYDDNGKSAAAAVYFDLVDNQEGARFFSDMTLGSAPGGREDGHTGHYWNALWGGLGAMRGGDKSLQVFMQVMDPVFTLERQPDGRFVFQDNVGYDANVPDPKKKWDCTGARLLQLCAPKRNLYITGKDTPRQTHLTQQRVDEILRAGQLRVSKDARAKLTKEQILELLRDPLPPTRYTGAIALAEQNINAVDDLIEMLYSDNRFARYGAAEALGKAGYGSQKAAEKLIAKMAVDDDLLFRRYAIDALINRDKSKGLLAVAKPAIPVLMDMALEDHPDDPRGVLKQRISLALFYKWTAQPRRGLLAEYGLEGVDRDKLVAVIREILKNDNGGARSLTRWVLPELDSDQLDDLWPDIYQASRNIAPSGIMFATEIQLHTAMLLAENRIKEGLDLAVWHLRHGKSHGHAGRVGTMLEVILKYGPHAKRVIPKMQEYAHWWETNRPRRGSQGKPDDPVVMIRETIKKIEAMPDEPTFELISISDQLDDELIVY